MTDTVRKKITNTNKIFTLMLTTLLLLTAFPIGAIGSTNEQAITVQENAPDGVSISINEQNVQFTEQSGSPFIDENNRIQVPFRITLEAFGAIVSWDGDRRTVTAEKNSTKVEVPIDEQYILKNGTKILNDTSAIIKDNRVYLPIRVVLEAFDAEVTWSQGSRTVVIITPVSKILTVHFIDVEQGDSIFIDYGEYEILIDAGVRKHGKTVVDYIKPYVDGALDLIVATHGDADHIAGLIDVIGAFDIDKIIHNGEERTTTTWKEFDRVGKSKSGCEYVKATIETIKIDDSMSIKIIPPLRFYSDFNENSVVVELTYNDVKVLFTGDMEKNSEKDLLNQFSKIDVLKSSHHGSRTSSTTGFLNIVKPDYVIISCGKDRTDGNSYGHPHLAALQRYFNIGATVYGTFRDGTIVMSSDGQTYSFDAKTPLTLNDAGDSKTNTVPPVMENNRSQDLQNAEIKYIGNVSSKRLHYPDCSSVEQIAEKNVIIFYSISETSGYSQCDICKPFSSRTEGSSIM